MSRTALGRLGLIASVLSLTTACDPGYGFWVRNDSGRTVIVQFLWAGNGAGYAVKAGASGIGISGLGPPWAGDLRVTTVDCKVLFTMSIDDRTGGIVIGSDGTVAWTTDDPFARGSGASEPSPMGGLPQTGKCLHAGTDYAPEMP